MAKKEDGDKGRKFKSSSLGNINQKKDKWGGGSDVVKPSRDAKDSKSNPGVDTKVFDKDGSNEIPWIADAAKKGDKGNVTGRLFPEAGTSCDFDGGEGIARPYDAAKRGQPKGTVTDR